MAKRKALSKKLRFEIFKRDSFTCQYCGNTPPKIILEIDHIVPVKKGGESDPLNLITSCFDCNRGKKDRSLSQIPKPLSQQISDEKKRLEQIEEFNKFLLEAKAKEDVIITKLGRHWFNKLENNEGYIFGAARRPSIKRFLKELTYIEIMEAMDLAYARICIYYTLDCNDDNKLWKYFCGICWNKIKESDYSHDAKKYNRIKNHYLSQKFGSGHYNSDEMKWLCDYFDEENIKSIVNEAFSEPRKSYWRTVMEIAENAKQSNS
jgi:hypothetical protein